MKFAPIRDDLAFRKMATKWQRGSGRGCDKEKRRLESVYTGSEKGK